MKSKLLLCIMLSFVVKIKAQSPDWAWANSNGGTDYEWGQSLATDAAGNTVIVGAFYSPTINFGSTVLTNPDSGKHTSYIVKYDTSGNIVWAKQPVAVGAWNYNRATGVGIDLQNNIYVTGIYFSTTLTFGSITITNNNCCLGAFYLAKFDPFGNILWAITTSGVHSTVVAYPPQPNYDSPLIKMSVNKNNGDLYIVGTYDSLTMTFGSTVLTNLTTNTGSNPHRDIFIAKYNSSGNFIWAKNIGGKRLDTAFDIAVNNSTLFVTGSFSSDTLNIGSLILTNPNQNGLWHNQEPFVAKYDTAGNPVWAKQGKAILTGINSARGKSIAADASGNCYLTGEFESSFIVFESDTLFNTATDFSKIFVVKYNSSGNVVWTKNFANGVGHDWAQGIETDGYGNVYVGGSFYSDDITFDSITLSSNGNGIFITQLTPYGSVLWAKAPGGSFNQSKHLVGLSVNAVGNVYLTGSFKGSIYFGVDTLTSNGQSDIFTAKINNIAVLGLQPQSNDSFHLSVYPNPTTSTFTITANTRIINPQIEIYNLMGVLVYREEIKSTTTNFSKQITLDKPAGIYLLKVFNGENYYCKKLIIE